MADTTTKPETKAPPPLTVAEVASFDLPPFLHGAKLTQDTLGGFSYRWHAGGFAYIAIPEKWEGRTLTNATAGGNPMGEFTQYAAENGVTKITTQTPGTLETNEPSIKRSLIPTDSSVATISPVEIPAGTSVHPAILIGGAIFLAFLFAAFVGSISYFAGRRQHGHS